MSKGITKHLLNIFATGELAEDSVCSILVHTAGDGKTYSAKSRQISRHFGGIQNPTLN